MTYLEDEISEVKMGWGAEGGPSPPQTPIPGKEYDNPCYMVKLLTMYDVYHDTNHVFPQLKLQKTLGRKILAHQNTLVTFVCLH